MSVLKSGKMIFNANTVIVSLLSVISTYLCLTYNLFADFPLTLIGIAVVFPIVFSINSAYKRREVALQHYGTMKALGRAIYLASRDWVPEPDSGEQKKIKELLGGIFRNCRTMLLLEKAEGEKKEWIIYAKFANISLFLKRARERGMKDSSRVNQYQSKMMVAFEHLKHIYQYRTPITLRAYSKIFMFVLPICYGPYFADLAQNYFWAFVPVVPVLFSIILVSLDNIQDHLENPFDLVGEDDVKINVDKYVGSLDH